MRNICKLQAWKGRRGAKSVWPLRKNRTKREEGINQREGKITHREYQCDKKHERATPADQQDIIHSVGSNGRRESKERREKTHTSEGPRNTFAKRRCGGAGWGKQDSSFKYIVKIQAGGRDGAIRVRPQ